MRTGTRLGHFFTGGFHLKQEFGGGTLFLRHKLIGQSRVNVDTQLFHGRIL